MRDLINTLFRWLARNVVTLIVVIAILIGGGFIKQQWDRFELANITKSEQLHKTRDGIEGVRKSAEEAVRKLVPLPGATTVVIEGKLKAIKKRLDATKTERKKLCDSGVFVSVCSNPFDPEFRKGIELDIQIKLLEQAYTYANQLYKQATDIAASRKEKEKERNALIAANAELIKRMDKKLAELGRLRSQRVPFKERYQISVSPLSVFPLKYGDKRVKKLKSELAGLVNSINKNTGRIKRLNEQIIIIRSPIKTLPFEIRPFETEGQKKLESEIKNLEKQLAESWFQRAAHQVNKVLPKALWIVFAIIVTPIAIKLFTFYVAAPLATRRPGICLLPGSSGLIQFGANNEVNRSGVPRASTVSKSIILDDKSELLVHPEFLQSVSLEAKKETKWLLDWAMPLTSLASGMYGLTRVYPDGSEPVVVSSSKDPLIEISEIDLPAGSAVVLQPRCLVGIVQRPDEPVCIKGYWRFGLSNWLTMQLRYVVFHGPAKLIVKGCRGIRIEPVNTGRAINQAAMLGFSANLQYAVTRCETFGSYLMGKQELFNDRFSGQPGCCIYEETPHPNARTGVTGRGIEGILDSFLKVFGI